MSNYWTDRDNEALERLHRTKAHKIEKQVTKYYQQAAISVIEEFENTYNKLLTDVASGRAPTPADLYKLDKYWQMQGKLRQELQKLGEKEIALLTKEFENHFFDVYNRLAIKGLNSFNTIDSEGARKLIETIWLADGKSFNQRIWKNTEKLLDTLNEQLVNTVVTGKKTSDLKKALQERFGVSYKQAKTLVNTELAHVQTVAAKQRYQDYGLTRYQILGNEDDTCHNQKGKDCHELDRKIFYYSEMQCGVNAPPFHPNCRCAIMPVIDD